MAGSDLPGTLAKQPEGSTTVPPSRIFHAPELDRNSVAKKQAVGLITGLTFTKTPWAALLEAGQEDACWCFHSSPTPG